MTDSPASEGYWQLSAASVRGKAHIDGSLPNQDSVSVVTNTTGDVICAVVSDGAGTAARSEIGSSMATEFIAQHMCAAGKKIRARQPALAEIRDELELGIALVRKRLNPTETGLRDFHCTLVVWLFVQNSAFVAQVGDSVALSTRFGKAEESGVQKIDFFPDDGYQLHEVERGEYANETHFITEPDWRKHLRIVQLPTDIDAVVLMTDGAMDVAMMRGKVFRGFLSNLLGKLANTADRKDRHDTIHAWLDDRQTHSVTGDDKTLFVALRQTRRTFANRPVYLGTEGAEAAPATSDLRAKTSRSASALTTAPNHPDAGKTPSGSISTPSLPPTGGTKLVRVLICVIGLQFLALAGLAYVHFAQSDMRPDEAFAQRKPGERSPKDTTLASIPAVDFSPPSPAPSASAPASASQVGEELRSPAAPASSPRPALVAKSAETPLAKPPDIRVAVVNATKHNPDNPSSATVTWKGGATATIYRIELSPDIVLAKNAEACTEGTQLSNTQKSCAIAIEKTSTAHAGEYKMTLKFESPPVQPWEVVLVFKLPPGAAAAKAKKAKGK